MKKEYFKLAFRNIKKRALRSWLTVLGIVIGAFLVVSLLSLSEGLNKAVMGELQAVGSNIVMVLPGDGLDMMALVGGAEIDDSEINAIKRARGVEVVLEMPYKMENVRHEGVTESVFIVGLDLREGRDLLMRDMGWETREGEFARPGRREVLVGHLVPRNIFPGLQEGDEITVSGRKYTVSGILRSLGNREDDSSIIFDLPDYRSVTSTVSGTPVAVVRIEDGFDIDTAIRNIEMSLEEMSIRRRGASEKSSYTVLSSEAMIEMVESILGVIQAGIIAFASIAILVGAIGIMNTMFTSVRERTKEIGILKAVGARRGNINSIFLVESGLIGLIGGILGVLFGLSGARLGQFVLERSPDLMVSIEAQAPFELIFFTLLFSFLLGCLSGYLPAKQAAKLNPVDALMYE